MATTDLQDPAVSANFGNIKNVGEMTSFAAGQIALASAQSFNRLSQIGEAAMAAAVRTINEVDPSEAVATSKLLTGDAVAQQGLASALTTALAQILGKNAGNTPPVTP